MSAVGLRVPRESGQAKRGGCSPRASAAASGWGLGAAPPSNRFVDRGEFSERLFFGGFLFLSSEGAFFSNGQPAIRRRRFLASAYTMTCSCRRRGTSALNLFIGVFAPREAASARHSKACKRWVGLRGGRELVGWLSSSELVHGLVHAHVRRVSPSSPALTRPVAIRHRSTASRRASATMVSATLPKRAFVGECSAALPS